MTTKWPTTLVSYHRSDEFTQDEIPDNLRESHTLKPGVWAMIRVLDGELEYTDLEADEQSILDPKHPGFVEPQVAHRVAANGAVRFYVEFFRDAGGSD